MFKKRELRLNELLKEERSIEALYEMIQEMSPHQLEFLVGLAATILSGKPVNK